MKLDKGNQEYAKTGTHLGTSGIKGDILDKLAQEIYRHKAYPTDLQLTTVAEALIKRHPCLKEPGSLTGYYGWKVSLKFKMGNYRSKLHDLGCAELTANSLKRKDNDGKTPAKNIKKAKKAEVNYLPDVQPSESEATLEVVRVALTDEAKKKHNETTINDMMQKTFPLRRRYIVINQPMRVNFCALSGR